MKIDLMQACTDACVDIYRDMTEHEAKMFLSGAKLMAWEAGKAYYEDKFRQRGEMYEDNTGQRC